MAGRSAVHLRKGSRLSEEQFHAILWGIILALTPKEIAIVSGISQQRVQENYFYIAGELLNDQEFWAGFIGTQQSYWFPDISHLMVDIVIMALKKGERTAQACLHGCAASFDRELVHLIFDTAIARPPDIDRLVLANRPPSELREAGPKTLERLYEQANRNIDARRVCAHCPLAHIEMKGLAGDEAEKTIQHALAIAKAAFGSFQLHFPRVREEYTLPLMWISMIAHSATWFGTFVPPKEHHIYAEDDYVPLLGEDMFPQRREFIRRKFHEFLCECLALRVKEGRTGTPLSMDQFRAIERGYREIMIGAMHTAPTAAFRL